MSTQEIVTKLWNLCNVLRDDGITYHQYVTELTYILFLKMAKETEHEDKISPEYRWDNLKNKEGIELKRFYNQLLEKLGEQFDPQISAIYSNAKSSIEEPKNLKKIITEIDKLNWFEAKEEGLGNLYEGLLEKNANEKKSGAGQYFTPRGLIDVMVKLINPQIGEKCFDPACGTFGFMNSAYLHTKYDENGDNRYFELSDEKVDRQNKEMFFGIELVHDTHRLAKMNAYLHGLECNIRLGDALSGESVGYKGYDVILTNPPFGTKKGGERATRSDISFATSNKQLNFLQVIYRSLKDGGRCAVVLPDNVLFAGGDGVSVRRQLMDFCDLHIILRLPTGIFYAQGVKTNVLFFTKGHTQKGNTKQVAFYDMRTNMDSFGKTRTLQTNDFAEFMTGYRDVSQRNGERWSVFSREDIEKKFADSLDLGLIKDDSIKAFEDLNDPIESGEMIVNNLEQAIDLIKSVTKELKALEKNNG